MNVRQEKILNSLKEDKKFIEKLIINDMNVIHERRMSLSKYRKDLNEINETIRKLVK